MSTYPQLRAAFDAFPLVWLVLTFAAFHVGVRIHRLAGGWPIASPVLIAVALLIAALAGLGVDYGTYLDQGGGILVAMLGPASVALAVPLYVCARRVRRSAVPLLCAVFAGGIAASASAVALAWLLGASDDILAAISLKSVTAPVAIGIAAEIGAIGAMAAAFAVLTGVCGTVLAAWVPGHARIGSMEALGLAAGVTAHGPGTAHMRALDVQAGQYSCVGTGLNAVLTALWLPAVMGLIAAVGR